MSFNIVSRRIYSDTLRVETSRSGLSMPHQFAGKARKYCKIVRLVPEVRKLHSP